MNRDAQRHLDKAKKYLDDSDELYRRAKPEIEAAIAAGASTREVSRYLLKSQSWVRDVLAWDGQGTLYGADTEARQDRQTRQILRDAPVKQIEEIVAALPPDRQRTLAVALDTESAKRQKERERVAKQKEREHLGDELVDGLEAREELQTTEYLLIKARGNLRGFVKHVGEIGVDNTPEAWRDSCLDWLEDLEGHIGMAKALLAGDDIDWTAFDELLAKEGG